MYYCAFKVKLCKRCANIRLCIKCKNLDWAFQRFPFHSRSWYFLWLLLDQIQNKQIFIKNQWSRGGETLNILSMCQKGIAVYLRFTQSPSFSGIRVYQWKNKKWSLGWGRTLSGSLSDYLHNLLSLSDLVSFSAGKQTAFGFTLVS